MTESGKPLKVAVLGCGSVGSQVVRLLVEQAADLGARVGVPVELAGVAVRRLDAARRRGERGVVVLVRQPAQHHRARQDGRHR